MTHAGLVEARDLLADGMTDTAAERLRTVVDGLISDDIVARRKIKELRQDIIVQLNLMASTRAAARRGQLSSDDEVRRAKQINFALLDLIDEAEAIAARAAVIAAAPMPAAAIAIPASPQQGLEKIWGRDNLQELSWLELGLLAARSVCRVVSPVGTGTGFIIGDGVLMTNNHVIPDAESARETRLEFNFEQDAARRLKPVTGYDVAELAAFATSPVDALDCTVMRFLASSDNGTPLSHWGTLTMASPPVEAAIGDPVTIIQHPNGGQKKIAVTANEIVNVFGSRLHYMTGTLPGSSGSPVFNDRWEVIALHHAGGYMVKNEKGDRFYANEGILIDAIRADPPFAQLLLDSRGLNP